MSMVLFCILCEVVVLVLYATLTFNNLQQKSGEQVLHKFLMLSASIASCERQFKHLLGPGAVAFSIALQV